MYLLLEMGRRTLYHTPEEKQKANRVKSKQHYDKDKKAICMRRSIRYRDEVQKLDRSFPPSGHPDYWCERAERVASMFTTLIGESSFHFIDNLYRQYIIDHNNNTFRDASIQVGNLLKQVRRAQEDILQDKGVGKELARCEEISASILNVLNALEDVLCHGMSGFGDVVESHSRRELLYQVLPSS
ncbi:hypothetical protein BDZ94DRAFT_1315809 [Collybia nuda]|uniref:Uncharacterized protein n=1 Tax=Collybia nuda TaxID=64659 RepID=A0A9P6CB81_9AGAR|nr:hypothetical protein BDZ94DRAFT_1316063 [Collybia nuda]KAF9455800.1 hypothetical protein BDZ94DRAFT_1315809 [Collybia nuda]